MRERLARIPRPRAAVAAAATGLRKNLGSAIALVCVALASGGGYLAQRWVTTSPRFAVEHIDVRGHQRVAPAAVRARLLGALGDNVFQVDLAALAADVEGEPSIARAQVRRELPDRLVVDVVEHVPAAVVELGGLYLADASGRVFARARTDRDDLAALPIVTGLDRALATRDPAALAAGVVEALALAAAWRAPAAARPPLGEIHLDADRGATIYLHDPAIAVHLGDGADPDALARRLAAFDAAWAALDSAERTRLASIHLGRDTTPARVTVAFADLEH